MQVTVLSREQRDEIHAAALGVLEEIGLKVESPALAARLNVTRQPSLDRLAR